MAAGASLHTMAILQASHAEVLKGMDDGGGVTPEAVKEFRRAADLALHATKHTVKHTSGFLSSELLQVAGFVHARRDAQYFPPTSVFPALAFMASLGHACTHEDAVSSPPLQPGSCPSLQEDVQSGNPTLVSPDTFHSATSVGLPPYLQGVSPPGFFVRSSSVTHTPICSQPPNLLASPVLPPSFPTWDISVVLKGLLEPPF